MAVFSADVRDEEAVKKAVDLAGPIDVLVCNQGVFVPREMEKQDAEEIKFTLDVNLLGNFHLIKAALPGMKDGASRDSPRSIAIISSQAGQVRSIDPSSSFSSSSKSPSQSSSVLSSSA